MKDKLKNILKLAGKQMASLICAAVALLAIVLSYWPTQGWFTDLQTKVGSSLSTGGQIDILLKKERHLPSVSVAQTTLMVLDIFPTDEVIAKGGAAVTQVTNQSTAILKAAVDINTHQPLVPGVLPSGSDIDRESFRRAYLKALTDDYRIGNWPTPDVQQVGEPIPALRPGHRLSEEQIKAALDDVQKDINGRFQDATGNVPADMKAAADAELAQAVKTVPLMRELEAAKQCKVYLEAGAIKAPGTAYNNIKQAVGTMATGDIWTAQLWLWIDEDVATAVARANAGAANVMESPIKQILDLTVKDPPYLIVGDPTAGKDDAPLTPAPDFTPTGRVCNGMYDVVHFSLSLDVDGRRVPQVLDAIQHGQFITVLCVESQAVDTADKASQHFIYGRDPVVHLDLACEELFLHDWTNKLQPADGGVAKYAAPGGAGAMGVPVIASPTTSIFPIAVHGAGM